MVRLCILALITAFSGACSTTSDPEDVATRKISADHALREHPSFPDHWYLVNRDPPTFYPRGLPENTPRTLQYGEMVLARDGGGRWFVPFAGAGDLNARPDSGR